jgi:hypothetical protein
MLPQVGLATKHVPPEAPLFLVSVFAKLCLGFTFSGSGSSNSILCNAVQRVCTTGSVHAYFLVQQLWVILCKVVLPLLVSCCKGHHEGLHVTVPKMYLQPVMSYPTKSKFV